MKLVIVSHTAHYIHKGRIVGYGATLREIDHLASLFDEVVHIAFLHSGDAPDSALSYCADNIHFRGIQPSGGDTITKKIRILSLYPNYARVISEELRDADAIHIRCPANVSALAAVMLRFMPYPRRRWIKYAGNWQSYAGEGAFYRFQRWWLTHNFAGAAVTVNGSWPNQPSHVHSVFNPCLTGEEVEAGTAAAAGKQLTLPVRLLFIGHLTRAKGGRDAVEVVHLLNERRIPSELTFVGDGPDRSELENDVRSVGMTNSVRFKGWIPRTQLGEYLTDAHFVLLPSRTEGWPKVLSEGMAYGAVPLSYSVGSIPEILGRLKVGAAVAPSDVAKIAECIAAYVENPGTWKAESQRAVEAAESFTFQSYLQIVRGLLDIPIETSK